MGVIADVQGAVIVNMSLDWTSYIDCSVTSVGYACLFTYHMFICVSVDFCYCNIKTCTVAKYLRIIFEGSIT